MKKCPILAAKEIVGAHFSRDFDDDTYDDMVTIGGKTLAANGGVHFYITCKLLDNARNEIHDISPSEYKSIFMEYYPWLNPDKRNNVDSWTMFKYIMSKSQILDLLKKQTLELSTAMEGVESKTRMERRKKTTGQLDNGPPQLPDDYTPEELHEWLKESARWLSSNKLIVPRIRKKPPSRKTESTIDIGPVSTSGEYRAAIARLMEMEVEECKYASGVEDYYVYAANYINDLLDAIHHK